MNIMISLQSLSLYKIKPLLIFNLIVQKIDDLFWPALLHFPCLHFGDASKTFNIFCFILFIYCTTVYQSIDRCIHPVLIPFTFIVRVTIQF